MLEKKAAFNGNVLIILSIVTIILANLSLYSVHFYLLTVGKNFRADQLYTYPGEPQTVYDFLRDNLRDKAAFIFYFVSVFLVMAFAFFKKIRVIFLASVAVLAQYPIYLAKVHTRIELFLIFHSFAYFVVPFIYGGALVYCLVKKYFLFAVPVALLFISSIAFFIVAMSGG